MKASEIKAFQDRYPPESNLDRTAAASYPNPCGLHLTQERSRITHPTA
jgi:hypothetical protein